MYVDCAGVEQVVLVVGGIDRFFVWSSSLQDRSTPVFT